jgi:hypothetical protein
VVGVFGSRINWNSEEFGFRWGRESIKREKEKVMLGNGRVEMKGRGIGRWRMGF